MTMTYAAYDSHSDKGIYSYYIRGEPAGVIGKFTPLGEPIVTADTLEELKLKAKAYLGEEPSAHLYLIDSENRVYDSLINTKYHEALERASRRTVNSIILLIFSITSLVAAAAGRHGIWALVGFCGVSIIYLILVWAFQEEFNAAILCEIMLVDFFLFHASGFF